MVKNIETEIARMLLDISSQSAKVLRENAFNIHNQEFKKDDDPVTELDRLVENMIREYAKSKGNFNYMGEEHGIEDNKSRYTWIIDPIDGTKSFVRGIFDSSISIAIRDDEKDTIINSCVYDFMRDIAYFGTNESLKMYFGNKEVEIPKYECDNSKLRILTNKKGRNIVEKMHNDNPSMKFEAEPFVGSIALLMAQTAIGAYEGFINKYPRDPKLWDVAAGYHLLSLNDEFVLMDSKGRSTRYDREIEGFMAIKKPYEEMLKKQL